ncbi:helix-turn-helix domain-containing protein [Pseudomonas sp. R5(2019)]|nr:helix-turn-helix domain-containing protein [Pseudomonas sp. R5(2019)]NBA95529.1 helix-turn-helix domain-containing protein [Pseudomonas sp. R5(2019)]
MSWALSRRDLGKDSSARHVLLCLANYAGTDGRGAFPSAKTLTEDTGLSERTVRSKLDVLEKLGLIVRGNQALAAVYIDRHDRRPVVYDLLIKRGAAAAPRAERSEEAVTGCNEQPNGVQPTTERGAAIAPNPSLNHQVTEEQEKALASFDEAGQIPEDERQRFDMFAGWQPADKDIRTQTFIRGVATTEVTPERVAKFIAYQVSKTNNSDTQAGWAYRLVEWIHRSLVQGQANAASAKTSSVRRPGGITLEQNLSDTSFADGVEPT